MQALGLIEVIGFTAAVEGADAALKAADIRLSGIAKVGGGIVTVMLMGDVSAVTASVSAGGEAARRVGTLRTTHVIPGAAESVILMLTAKRTESHTPAAPAPKSDLYEKSNAELKEMINEMHIPFDGKQIKYARKEELVAAIENYSGG